MSSSRWAVPIIFVVAFAAALAGWAVPPGKAEPEPVSPVAVFVFAEMVQAADAFVARCRRSSRRWRAASCRPVLAGAAT